MALPLTANLSLAGSPLDTFFWLLMDRGTVSLELFASCIQGNDLSNAASLRL